MPELCSKHELIDEADLRTILDSCPGYPMCCPKYILSSQTSQFQDEMKISDLPKCGISVGVNMRIFGYQFFEGTRLAQYPWMVAIFAYKNGMKKYLCGGSLIHPRVVLTAAHCMSGAIQRAGLVFRVGDWDLEAAEEFPVYQERAPDEIVVHHKFYTNRMSYDVALVMVKGSYKMNRNVGFVCLPALGTTRLHSTTCRVMGWGMAKYTAHRTETKLRMVELPVVNNEECEKELGAILREDFVLDSSFMCAGGLEGQDACVGDSGSPLVCRSENGYVQHGIVSWGVKCGQRGVPGVYTNVTTVKDWIDKEMKRRGFSLLTYTPS